MNISSSNWDGQLLQAEVTANPYPYYHQLRNHSPIYYDGILQMWLVTEYDLAVAILGDRERFSSHRDIEFILRRAGATQTSEHPVCRQLVHSLTYSDPPDHTRLRKLINKAFAPKVMQRIRPHIGEIVDQLLAALGSRREMDILADLAYPLTQIVICELLGVEPDMRDRFKGWADDFVAVLGTTQDAPEVLRRADRSSVELYDYFRKIVAKRRLNPEADLISGLALAQEAGDSLTEDELFATCAVLLTGGYETTANLIGNGTLALLRHPEQRQQLLRNPESLPLAIEELLRYDSPAQWGQRRAKCDVQLAGVTIKAGETVLIGRAAANRDPAQFLDPDQLDLRRDPNPHIAFGYGIHFCIGAELARIEATVTFERLLPYLETMTLSTESLQWRPNMHVRGLTALPVTF